MVCRHPNTVGPPSPTTLNLSLLASIGREWAQGPPTLHQGCSLCVPISSLPRGAGVTELLGAVALQHGDTLSWHTLHTGCHSWASAVPRENSPLGKAQKPTYLRGLLLLLPRPGGFGIWNFGASGGGCGVTCNKATDTGYLSQTSPHLTSPLLQPQPALWVSTKIE